METSTVHTVSQSASPPARTQRAYLNAVSSFLDYGARVGVSFVITPLLVSGLGSTLFGIWQVLNKTVSYMAAADGRPMQAIKWVIANYQDSDDISHRQRAIGSALGVWLLMLPVSTLVGAILVWLSPVIVKTPPEMVTLVRVTTSLLVFNLMLAGLISLPESVLRGMNLGYKRMGLVAGMNILDGLLVAGALYLGWGLIGVAGAHLLRSLLTGILFWTLVKAYLPWFGAIRVSWQEIQEFFGLSIWYAAWNLVNRLLLSSDVVVLGVILSAAAVTEYTLTGYVAQTLLAVATMMVGAAVPGLGGLIGQRHYDQVIELRNEMLWISSLVAGVLGSMILLWNRSFIALWVGSEHYTGPIINLLLVLMAVQLLFLRNETYLIDLTLDVKRKVTLGLASALLSIVLGAVLTARFGVPGLCLGIMAGRLLLTIAYPALTAEFFDVSLRSQFEPVVRSSLVMGGLFMVLAVVGQYVVVQHWLALVGYAGISLPLVLLLFAGLGFSPSERKRLVRRVKNLKLFSADV